MHMQQLLLPPPPPPSILYITCIQLIVVVTEFGIHRGVLLKTELAHYMKRRILERIYRYRDSVTSD
jgi:hypothetical protein